MRFLYESNTTNSKKHEVVNLRTGPFLWWWRIVCWWVREDWVKISVTMAGRREKILKLHWLKHLQTVPKNWTRKSVIQNLIFGLYFLILDFLAESIKANKKLATNVSHFTIPFPSKNLNSLNVVKKKYSHNKAKNLSHFSNFSANIILVGVKKTLCTAPFADAQELHPRSTCSQSIPSL